MRTCNYILLPAVAFGLARAAAAEDDFAGRIDKLVAERQPTAGERRFDEIGWLTDIREALRLAKETKRPVLLFTHDGRMAVGRC